MTPVDDGDMRRLIHPPMAIDVIPIIPVDVLALLIDCDAIDGDFLTWRSALLADDNRRERWQIVVYAVKRDVAQDLGQYPCCSLSKHSF